jgi:hypothetical protein
MCCEVRSSSAGELVAQFRLCWSAGSGWDGSRKVAVNQTVAEGVVELRFQLLELNEVSFTGVLQVMFGAFEQLATGEQALAHALDEMVSLTDGVGPVSQFVRGITKQKREFVEVDLLAGLAHVRGSVKFWLQVHPDSFPVK